MAARTRLGLALSLAGLAAVAWAADRPTLGDAIEIEVRTRREVKGKEQPVLTRRTVEPAKAAVVICDMWDDHWCKSAATRCDALAKAAGPLIDELRRDGMTIIHCPSDCMAFYKDHPARKRALAVKPTAPPRSKELPNPPLPIDDSDGGCDDGPTPFRKAWTRQHVAIRIDPERDFVTDTGKEVYGILADRGVKTVFVMGVHTNMCVLNRTFAIKQLRRWGVDCVLVRDLTDTMYNPKMRPFVDHDEGTQLVVRYIERYWCPTVESKELVKRN